MAKSKSKKGSILRFIRWKNLKGEISGYGYDYSFKKYLLMALIVLVGVVFVGWFYKLKTALVVLLGVASLCFLPIIIYSQFRFMYKQKEFGDVDNYLHQMIYSFQRSRKIITALEDTHKVSSGRMQEVIGDALETLSSSSSYYVFEEALEVIEEAYPCDRVITLHRFLVSVEKNGGKYANSLGVLLADVNNWVKRVYKNQQDLKQYKNEVALSMLICFITGSASVLVGLIFSNSKTGISMNISNDWLYQWNSVAFLLICVLYYSIVQLRNIGEWLGKPRTDEKIQKDFNWVFSGNPYKVMLMSLPVVAVFVLLGVGIMLLMESTLGYVIGAVFFVFALWILFIPILDKKSSKSRLAEDVYANFSDWLRDVAINIQREPLIPAIEDTYETAPLIIKHSLGKFIREISDNPSDVIPYHHFLEEYEITDISTTVMMLYSFSEMDEDNVDEAINSLIKRNSEMIDKHEELKAASAKSLRNFSSIIPTVFITVKIALDMIVMLSVLTQF